MRLVLTYTPLIKNKIIDHVHVQVISNFELEEIGDVFSSYFSMADSEGSNLTEQESVT